MTPWFQNSAWDIYIWTIVVQWWMLIEQWVPDRSHVCCVVGAGFQLCVFSRPSWPTAYPVTAEKRCWSWALLSCVKLSSPPNLQKHFLLSGKGGKQRCCLGSEQHCPCEDSGSDNKYFIGHSCLIKVSSNTLNFSYSFIYLLFSMTCLLECLTLLILPGEEGNHWFWHFLNRKSQGTENFIYWSKLGEKEEHRAILKIPPRCLAPLSIRY